MARTSALLATKLRVAEEVGLGQVAEGGAGGLLAAPFPGGAGAGLLFGASGFEAFVVELNAEHHERVDHEI
jgi:hypothetical protein